MSHHRLNLSAAAACIAALTLSSLPVAPATAAEDNHYSETIASASQESANALRDSDGSAFRNFAGELTAEVPATGDSTTELSPQNFSLTYVPSAALETIVEEEENTRFATYDDGAAVTALNHDDDSKQFISILESPESDHTQTFRVDSGEAMQLKLEDDESVTILNDTGAFVGGVTTPWAKDANGDAVNTRFSISGNIITQQTDLVDRSKYPVVVDPWGGKKLISKAWVSKKTSKRWVVNVVPTKWGRFANGFATHRSHVAELKAKVGSKRVTKTIDNQFICHVAGNYFEPGTYNMESWRPNMHWSKQLNLKHRCNPK